MSVEITQDSISKLTHDSPEIRLRSLEQIETKFVRASALQLYLEFNAVELCKQLVRYFGLKPLECTNRVLRLLSRILASRYGNAVLDNLGICRLKQELQKIRTLLQKKPEDLHVLDILLEELSDKENLSKIRDGENDVVEILQKLSVRSSENVSEGTQYYKPEDCENAWSRPTTADYNNLKYMSDVLISAKNNVNEITNTLDHLQVIMADYPAEYMLQSPHIFCNLLQLFGRHDLDGMLTFNIVSTIRSFLKILRERLHQRRRVENYAMPPKIVERAKFSQKGLQAKSQLKVQKATELLLENFLEKLTMHPVSMRSEILHIMKATVEVLNIFQIQKFSISTKILQQVFQAIEQLKNECLQDNFHLELARTRYLWLTFVLHEMADINAKCSQLLGQHKLLKETIYDYSLQKNYPQRFNEIKTLLLSADPLLEHFYEPIDCWKTNIEAAIIFLKDNHTHALLTNAAKVITTLDTIKSLKLLKLIFDAILNNIPLYLKENELKEQAARLVCQLLRLQHPPLKAFVYRSISVAVKKHFAALMNEECYCSGVRNRDLLTLLIIGVPLNNDILQLIIHEVHETNCELIKENAIDTILLLLQTKHFFDLSWEIFLEVVSVMPLLQCIQDASAQLKESVIKLLDPDTKQVPFMSLLCGNIGFMFEKDSTVRSEALTRLIYILNSLPANEDYIPNIMEIRDILPNDLCISEKAREFRHIFAATETYYELSTMSTLLSLLDTADIEPQVRKSTLLQLNLMLKNWQLTAAFCDLNAHCLLLRVLENSLQKSSSMDYIESIIPTVSILAKLLIYDKNFREELASIPNVYMLLLRALFYYSQHIQVREDISICLFLLVFGNYIVAPLDSGCFVVPKLFESLKLPLVCNHKPMTKTFDCEDLQRAARNVFSNEKEWISFMRQVIANAYFQNKNFSKNEIEEMRVNLDICPTLLMQPHDIRLLKASDSFHSIRALLRTIENATDDKILVKASNSLQLYLMLTSMEQRNNLQFPAELSNGIFSVLSKYLQVTPGNAKDLEVYVCVLDLLHFCLLHRFELIGLHLKNMLRLDFYHGMILMLQNSELPIDFFLRLSEFFIVLLANRPRSQLANNRFSNSTFRSNLFELTHKLILQYQASRELHRARCLLRIMTALCSSRLALSSEKIYFFSRSFLRLSINIGSTTQTGAQWHRDCLLIFSQLISQLPNDLKAKVSQNILKHLIGLAGHNDSLVRTLTWTCLSQIAYVDISECSNMNDAPSCGAQILARKIMHLPGGLIGCCLSTFFDFCEIVVVRHFAGLIFVSLLNETCTFESAIGLLQQQHAFFSEAYNSLENCMFERLFQLHSPYLQMSQVGHENETDRKLVTCDLIACFCRICFALIRKKPDFVEELCEKQLLFKLYELMKLPPVNDNPSYYIMCAQICQLYAACSKDNFIFLQRTLCHDERWLTCFFDLLQPPLNAPEACIAWIVQLLLSLCREDYVYQKLCTYLTAKPILIQMLCQCALTVSNVNCALQRCTLSLLSYLLIKCQPDFINMPQEIAPRFALVLETKISIPVCTTHKVTSNKNIREEENENLHKSESSNNKKEGNRIEKGETEMATLSELIFVDLYKIFTHFYPSNICKFEVCPSASKVQVCETISILLKISPDACQAATNLKLFDCILHILTTFVQEINIPYRDFVRRHGETKKLAVIRNLQLLFQVIKNWYSSTGAVLTDELSCLDLSKVLIQIWPWISNSSDLRMIVIWLCASLSERSLVVCRQFSTLISSYAHSILQLIIKLAISETHRMKSANASDSHISIINIALRVMINCCACGEGRFALVKERTLDVFDGLYPFNMKSTKIRSELLQNWLQFWELFSRYNEGGQVRHLSPICSVVNRLTPGSPIRLLCLKILRNMCFVLNNRSFFIASSDFLQTIYEVIGQPVSNDPEKLVSYEEQLIASVAIWQILCGGAKYVANLRGTKLIGKLRSLREKISVPLEEISKEFKEISYCTDLINVIDIIFTFFD